MYISESEYHHHLQLPFHWSLQLSTQTQTENYRKSYGCDIQILKTIEKATEEK